MLYCVFDGYIILQKNVLSIVYKRTTYLIENECVMVIFFIGTIKQANYNDCNWLTSLYVLIFFF